MFISHLRHSTCSRNCMCSSRSMGTLHCCASRVFVSSDCIVVLPMDVEWSDMVRIMLRQGLLSFCFAPKRSRRFRMRNVVLGCIAVVEPRTWCDVVFVSQKCCFCIKALSLLCHLCNVWCRWQGVVDLDFKSQTMIEGIQSCCGEGKVVKRSVAGYGNVVWRTFT